MAGNSVIGALRVVLGADTAQLDKGLKDAQGSLARFGAQMKNVGAVAAGVLAGVIGGSAAAIKSAVNEADKLGKMAQSIGLPVEELSKLKYAAELSDISLESLSTSMVKLSKNMSAVAGGAGGPAAEAFKALGVSVRNTDGTMKSSSVVLSEVADKFAGYEDGANKTALAVALFGRAGASMIPMLNAGSAAIADAGKEAEAFGLVIDKKTAVAAENFNDNLTRLSKVANGLWIQIAAQLAPELSKLSNIFVQLAKDGGIAKSGADMIAGSMSGLVQTAMTLALMWRRLGAEWNALRTFLQTDIFSGKLTENWNKFNEAGRETQLQLVQLKAKFEDDPMGNADDAIAGLSRGVGELNKNLGAAPALATGAKNALVSFLDSQAKSTASRNAEAATIGLTTGALEKLKVQQQAELIAKQNNITLTAALSAKITEAGNAAAEAALRVQGANLTQEHLAPWEKQNQLLRDYKVLLDNGKISQDTFTAASLSVQFPNFTSAASQATNFGMQMDQFATNAVNGLSDALTGVILGTQKASVAFKQFAVKMVADLVAMIVKAVAFQAIMTAIGFPGAAAGGFLNGIPQGVGLGGFGGSFAEGGRLSAGKWGIAGEAGPELITGPANIVPFEDLDMPAGGSSNNSRAAGGTPSVIELRGFTNSPEQWPRDRVRAMMEAVQDAISDGYTLKLS